MCECVACVVRDCESLCHGGRGRRQKAFALKKECVHFKCVCGGWGCGALTTETTTGFFII